MVFLLHDSKVLIRNDFLIFFFSLGWKKNMEFAKEGNVAMCKFPCPFSFTKFNEIWLFYLQKHAVIWWMHNLIQPGHCLQYSWSLIILCQFIILITSYWKLVERAQMNTPLYSYIAWLWLNYWEHFGSCFGCWMNWGWGGSTEFIAIGRPQWIYWRGFLLLLCKLQKILEVLSLRKCYSETFCSISLLGLAPHYFSVLFQVSQIGIQTQRNKGLSPQSFCLTLELPRPELGAQPCATRKSMQKATYRPGQSMPGEGSWT